MGSGRLWLFGNNHSKIVHGTKPPKTKEKTAKNGDFPRFLMIKQGCVVNTVRFAAGTPKIDKFQRKLVDFYSSRKAW